MTVDRLPLRRPRGLLLIGALLGVTSLTGVFTVAGSANAPTLWDGPPDPKPTVVLVHGAFADGSSWDAVTKRLQRHGFPVIVAANPLRSLSGDAAMLASLLASIEGPIILVGHSYGGMVMTNAAAGNENVKALVYIAAFAPAPGETTFGLAGLFLGSELPTAIHPVPFMLPDGSTGVDAYIALDMFHSVFAPDVPAKQAAVMAAQQRPATLLSGEEPSIAAAWETIPAWYMVATEDKVIPPDAQRFMAERAGAHTVELPGSHVIMVSKPGPVVDLIREAAIAVS